MKVMSKVIISPKNIMVVVVAAAAVIVIIIIVIIIVVVVVVAAVVSGRKVLYLHSIYPRRPPITLSSRAIGATTSERWVG